MIDVHGKTVVEPVDLDKGRIELCIIPKDGCDVPPGIDVHLLPPECVDVTEVYIEYTQEEIKYKDLKKRDADVDAMIVDQEYRLSMLELGLAQ